MKKETIGTFEIIIATILFGFIPVLVRFGSGLGAYNLSFFRILVAALFLFLLSMIFKRSYKIKPLKQYRKKIIFFGAIHGFIILAYFFAIQYLQVAQASLLIYSSAIWMTLFSSLILKEKITRRTFIALILSITGVVLVLSTGNLFSGLTFVGVLSGLFAGVSSGLVWVLSKTIKRYDRVSITFWQNLIAIPFLLPLVFIKMPHFNLSNLTAVILLGVFCTVIPFVLVFKGLQKVKGQTGGILLLLDIVFSIFFAFVILGESPALKTIIGGILIIIGSYLASQ